MNNDLISREALKKVLSDPLYRSTIKDYGEILKYTFVMDIIENVPTVECTWIISGKRYGKKEEALKYLRPHGEWIFRTGTLCVGYYKCSECGEVERAEKNFCPNCGADMRTIEKDNNVI